MCGIAGFVDASAAARGPELRRMIDALTHRGPDDAGEWRSADGRVQLGHRRLSILDLSAEGAQPMRSAGGRRILAFNGEIYNHGELRRALEAAGAVFRGHSDTEVLLAAIEAWGLEPALGRAVGMFALALWDDEARCLSLAVDRLGEKPLYYGWAGATLLFGSELKALRAHPAWRGRIAPAVVAEYLRCGYVCAPASIYEGIARVGGGTLVAFDSERLFAGTRPSPRVYWSVAEVFAAGRRKPWSGDEAAAVEELDRLLGTAVSLQMIADVPVGAFLSGGIDSSTIVALMAARAPRPVRTFAIGFGEAAFNEATHARAVAAHLGTRHTELIVTPADALAVVPRLPEIYDEPFADPSQIPTFLVAALARDHVTVSLSGDAGDELFLGYRNYEHVRRIWRWSSRMPQSARAGGARALRRLLAIRLAHGRAATRLRRLAKALPAHSPSEMHQLLTRLDTTDLLSPDLARATTAGAASETLPPAMAGLTQLGAMDLTTYLPDDILVKVDRAAMAVSLETRIPFLDHRVVEFALALPESLKVRGGVGKWIVRRVLDRYVPLALVDRPKSGFAVPISAWLRGPLHHWGEALLASRRLSEHGLLDSAAVRSKWQEHQEGVEDHSDLLWRILMLQAWLEHTGGR